jgi:predicted AAA+ superfamily ATPase
MLKRAILLNLQKWANSTDRKPLILRGARQVGKTCAVNMFSKNFDIFIYLNLEIHREAMLFSKKLDVKELFQSILLYKKIQKINGKVLLFIDEIQHCPAAVAVLRYFYEDLPEIYVIAAGSLFEIMMQKNKISFPVGRVEYLYMYPLTFREYLYAVNHDSVSLLDTIPLPRYCEEHLFSHFHKYTQIGGMPEVVAKYLKTGDLISLNNIYQSLLNSYLDDIAKYARNPSNEAVLRHCIESAPYEAGQRIKFAGFGKSNYRSREVGDAIKTLQRAMLISLFYPSTSTEIPIMPDRKKSPRL